MTLWTWRGTQRAAVLCRWGRLARFTCGRASTRRTGAPLRQTLKSSKRIRHAACPFSRSGLFSVCTTLHRHAWAVTAAQLFRESVVFRRKVWMPCSLSHAHHTPCFALHAVQVPERLQKQRPVHRSMSSGRTNLTSTRGQRRRMAARLPQPTRMTRRCETQNRDNTLHHLKPSSTHKMSLLSPRSQCMAPDHALIELALPTE